MIDFNEPRLSESVEKLSPEEVNALPFGVVRLDSAGKVVLFSEAERRLSGYWAETLGRSFFVEIAPCMNNPTFKGRIEAAMATGRLNLAFGHVGDFADLSRTLDVRVQSASGGGCWIFLKRGE